MDSRRAVTGLRDINTPSRNSWWYCFLRDTGNVCKIYRHLRERLISGLGDFCVQFPQKASSVAG